MLIKCVGAGAFCLSLLSPSFGLASPEAADRGLARLYKRDPTIRMLDPEADKQVDDLVRRNPRLLKLIRKEMVYEPRCPEWYTNNWFAPGANPNIHGGRLLDWLTRTLEEQEENSDPFWNEGR